MNFSWTYDYDMYFYYRYNFHETWPRTKFILNLAFADLLMCIIVLPIQSILLYFYKKWSFGLILCKIMAVLTHGIQLSEWMSVALVALNCCVTTTQTKFLEPFFLISKNQNMLCLMVWLIGFGILIPTMINVSIFGRSTIVQ